MTRQGSSGLEATNLSSDQAVCSGPAEPGSHCRRMAVALGQQQPVLLGSRSQVAFPGQGSCRGLTQGHVRCRSLAAASSWPQPQHACLHQQWACSMHAAQQHPQLAHQRVSDIGQFPQTHPLQQRLLLQRPGVRLARGPLCKAASDSSSGSTSPSSGSSSGGSLSTTNNSSSNGGSNDGEQGSSTSNRHSSSPQQVSPPPAPRPPPTNNSWKPFAWFNNKGRGSKGGSKMQQPVRLLLNLVMLFFLMRLWPMGGRLGLGESETLVMSVPFSEFVRRVRHDDVQTVSVDGLHVTFNLKPGSLSLPGG